ncbi:MAG: DUF2254 domain-containing protein [Candidatus Nanopelagicales bacterium]
MRREALREYLGGALWVMPFGAGILAVAVANALVRLEPADEGLLGWLAFQGTSDAAREMLLAIAGTVVTVIALVLGLSVVALQLSTTQFSPRLLRNFLRDRPNQVALSVFMATFAYCATLLFSVGVGPEPEVYPRVAVNLAIVALFASMAMVVYFADHLSHSLQVEAIMRQVESEALEVIANSPSDVDMDPPTPPQWALAIPAAASGYVQTTHPELLLPLAIRHGVGMALTTGVGQHIAAGSPLALIWKPSPDDPPPDLDSYRRAFDADVGIGFERTQQQDSAFGIRQLVDVAVKALSPAVNDPYTAVQALHHMTAIFGAMALRPLGPRVARAAEGPAVVVVPSREFGQYLAKMCGLVRRYGSSEPTVMTALLRLMDHCALMASTDGARLVALSEQARLVAEDSVRDTAQPADAAQVIEEEAELQRAIAAYRAGLV